MLLDDVADLLTSGGVARGVGSTQDYGCWKSGAPAFPDKAITLYESGGLGFARTLPGVALEHARVQVVVRVPDGAWTTGRQKAQAVFRALDQLAPRTINGVRYAGAFAIQSPFLIGLDENHRLLIGANYDVHKALSTV